MMASGEYFHLCIVFALGEVVRMHNHVPVSCVRKLAPGLDVNGEVGEILVGLHDTEFG